MMALMTQWIDLSTLSTSLSAFTVIGQMVIVSPAQNTVFPPIGAGDVNFFSEL